MDTYIPCGQALATALTGSPAMVWQKRLMKRSFQGLGGGAGIGGAVVQRATISGHARVWK